MTSRSLRRRGAAALVASCLALAPAVASAQTATPLDRFEPAPAGDTFLFVPSAQTPGHIRPGAALALSFAKSPLVLVDPRLDEPEIGNVVGHQLALHAMASLELFHRLKLELDVPATLTQDGESPTGAGLASVSPSGAAMNDIRFSARLTLLEQRGHWPAVAAKLGAWFPSGNDDAYTSSGHVRLAPSVIIGADHGRFVWSTMVGRRLDTSDGTQLLGHEMLFGAAAGPRIGPVLVSAEVWGSSVAQQGTDLFSAATTHAEAQIAVRYDLGPFHFRLAGGPGLTTGIGAPDYRAVATVGYAPVVSNEDDAARRKADEEARRRRAAAEKRKRDAAKRAEEADRDGDRVVDREDACPDVAGVDAPGPRRGCPADGDGDGVADGEDACPKLAGVRSPDPNRDGCPADQDGDGIVDTADACPREKGLANADPKKNGCPTTVRIVGTQIVILKRIEFETASAKLRSASTPVLQQVADVMKQHPEIVRVAIEGHTDNVGDERRNIRLSQQRALTVMRWMIDRGIDERRLETRGYGPRQPVEDNGSAEGRAKNRRVEFRILKRSPKGAQAWTDGPVEAP